MHTPLHIKAEKGAISESVLLPGDPLRAEFIAKTFLTDVFCYNKIRGMYGFTGTYKNKRISIQGTGMGAPSISIYANELLNFYGAKKLIRVGSCGSIQNDINLRDVILATGASSDSSINRRRFGFDYAPTANFELLKKAHELGLNMNLPIKTGTVLSSDLFYDDTGTNLEKLASYGTLAVEMETAELYTLAPKYSAQALSILTVSDRIFTGESLTSEEREQTFTDMITLALETV